MINKAILIGRLGADPEVRYTQGGTAVANLRVATTEVFNDQSGQRQERTQWHNVVVWGRQAETCGRYLSKGRLVYIEGRIQYRQWTDRDNNTRWSTDIVAQTVKFLGGRGDRPEPRSPDAGPPHQPPGPAPDDHGGPVPDDMDAPPF